MNANPIIPAALTLGGITVNAGRRALVNSADLDVAPGRVMGLIGPNGAGKSTLLRTIYRARRPDSGTVKLDGKDIWRQPARWCARNVAAVLQDMPVDFPLTVSDIIAMGRAPHKGAFSADTAHDATLITSAIELLSLTRLADQPFIRLSGGERQRVLLARALVQQPRLLVLDEPTNHLDLHHQVSFLSLVRQIGTTVIAALHDLTLAAMFCDRLAMMQGGRIIATGTPDTVLEPARIRQVYGVSVTVIPHPTRGTPVILPV